MGNIDNLAISLVYDRSVVTACRKTSARKLLLGPQPEPANHCLLFESFCWRPLERSTWNVEILEISCAMWWLGPVLNAIFFTICHVHFLNVLFVYLPAVDVEPELSSLWSRSFVKDCRTPEPMQVHGKLTAISSSAVAFLVVIFMISFPWVQPLLFLVPFGFRTTAAAGGVVFCPS